MEMFGRDFKAFLDRVIEEKHREMLEDGVEHMRDMMQQRQEQLTARAGGMCSYKVCDIQNVLVQELEQSITDEVSLVCGTFHTWRAHVMLLRTAESYDFEVNEAREKWEAYFKGETSRFEEASVERASVAKIREAKWRQGVTMVVSSWVQGDKTTLKRAVLSSWQTTATFLRSERLFHQRFAEVAGLGHGMVHRWVEDSDKNLERTCFISWLSQLEAKRVEMRTRGVLEQLFSDERSKYSEALEDQRSEVQRVRAKQRAVVGYTLERWEFGDNWALAARTVGTWRDWCQRAKRLSQERQSVHAAMLQSIEGNRRGVLHTSFLNWKVSTKVSIQRREGDVRLGVERERWEALLEDASKSHQSKRDDAKAEGQARLARAHEATVVMLRQWMMGDSEGLLAAIFEAWWKSCEKAAAEKFRRQSVHAGVLRFLESDNLASAHLCLLNWKRFAKVQAVYRTEVLSRESTIATLKERSNSIIGTAQARVVRYLRMLFDGDNASLQMLILHRWAMEAHGVATAENKRKWELKLQEMKLSHAVATTKNSHEMACVFHCLDSRNITAFAKDIWLVWKRSWQEAKHQWTLELHNSRLLEKFGKHMIGKFTRGDDKSLLGAVLWEFSREARRQRREREREEEEKKFENAMMMITQLTEARNTMQQDLQVAYNEIDRVTESLKREIKSKEGLTKELDDLHKAMRRPLS
eukprot:TRINITY_DN27263_c0_g3_i1.p1 TRINITY_DN27263_c0_g3~~TRINITY_DN27263_c0_g3_i1.p1  ORF type:complete len:795 (-),score=116.74 TRINITY_DN27263_c0_g3_i1:269-2356(-)